MASTTMEEIEPTYVIYSPFKLRHSKWVDHAVTHGPLILAFLSLFCVIEFRQNCNGLISLGYLPLCIFYSFVYLFGRFFNAKAIISIQILFTYVFIVYCPYLMFVAGKNVHQTSSNLAIFVFLSLVFYMFALQIAHRRHYTNNLSTPESILNLNKRDVYHTFFCHISIVGALVVIGLGMQLFPAYLEASNFVYFLIACGSTLSACLATYSLILDLNGITRVDMSNRKVDGNVQFDSDGRAWWVGTFFATANELDSNGGNVGEESEPISVLFGQWFDVCKKFVHNLLHIQSKKSVMNF